jgi:hypothetical protein
MRRGTNGLPTTQRSPAHLFPFLAGFVSGPAPAAKTKPPRTTGGGVRGSRSGSHFFGFFFAGGFVHGGHVMQPLAGAIHELLAAVQSDPVDYEAVRVARDMLWNELIDGTAGALSPKFRALDATRRAVVQNLYDVAMRGAGRGGSANPRMRPREFSGRRSRT